MNLAEELEWLRDHPEFEERPATLLEFLGDDYLNIENNVRESIKRELSTIMGEDVNPEKPTEYPLAIVTGAIGIGKTTIASIVLPYLCHWMLCLKDPQGHFNLLAGSRIAFMQMSTSETQARDVIFGDIKARINHSPWFSKKYPYNPKFTKQIKFAKDIFILPGDSAETTFEGYNIFGGILDEADSHKVTEKKDYAQTGYETIHARVTSRFEDKGFLMIIGQMKSSSGFAAKIFRDFSARPDAHAVRMTIWESLGWDHYRDPSTGEVDVFYYDVERKTITTSGMAALTGSSNIIKIPKVFMKDFVNNPEKALRDLAGIPPTVGDPFISLTYKVTEAVERWTEVHGDESPVSVDGRIADWFRCKDTIPRVAHMDFAYSANGDSLGLAVGHVRGNITIDGENKPYIVIDLLLRLNAPKGSEVFFSDVRQILYSLRDDRGFKIKKVTMDGFESTDTKQQLRRRKIASEIISVDRDLTPYYDLREAIYENRIDFPPYAVKLRRGDTETVQILVKELSELVDEGKKIDHPHDGSKDVSDAVAGVTTTLMGDRRYHRKVVNLDDYRQDGARAVGGAATPFDHPAFLGNRTGSLPVPPSVPRSPFR